MVNLYLESYGDSELAVECCRCFTSDINCRFEKYVVDAKSILGVLSLVGKNVIFEMISDNEKEVEKFEQALRKLRS